MSATETLTVGVFFTALSSYVFLAVKACILDLFYLLIIKSSTFFCASLFLFFETKFPPHEKTLSLLDEEAGIEEKIKSSTFDKRGKSLSNLVHHIRML